MTKIIAQFPGYTLIEAAADHEFTDGDRFGVPYETRRYGTLHRFYTLGDVRSYARRYGDDENAAEARAVERGHELYYAFQNATVISTMQRERPVYPVLNHGDVISYAGKRFRIDPTANGNVKLTEVAA